MTSILIGLAVMSVGIIIYLIYTTVKATKDPDVQMAAELHMSINNYRKYQKLYDKLDAFLMTHDPDGKEADAKFVEIFKQIKNPNEWRRCQNYREKKQTEEFQKEIFGQYK